MPGGHLLFQQFPQQPRHAGVPPRRFDAGPLGNVFFERHRHIAKLGFGFRDGHEVSVTRKQRRPTTNHVGTAVLGCPAGQSPTIAPLLIRVDNPDQQWRNGRALPGWAAEDGCPHMVRCRPTLFSCYTDFVTIAKSKAQLRNVTVTLEEDVAKWARIEAARRDTSVSRLLGELLKEQ